MSEVMDIRERVREAERKFLRYITLVQPGDEGALTTLYRSLEAELNSIGAAVVPNYENLGEIKIKYEPQKINIPEGFKNLLEGMVQGGITYTIKPVASQMHNNITLARKLADNPQLSAYIPSKNIKKLKPEEGGALIIETVDGHLLAPTGYEIKDDQLSEDSVKRADEIKRVVFGITKKTPVPPAPQR